MFATIINDCRDENAIARQAIRTAHLLGFQPTTIGVKNDAEAAGNLIDCLDAAFFSEGVILVNVAPRANNGYTNGIAFCYTRIGHTHVFTVASKVVLGLLKKLRLSESYSLLDIQEITSWALARDLIYPGWAARMQDTQFRSYEFLPWIASVVAKGGYDFPSQKSIQLPNFEEPIVWWVDNFGNAKTSLFVEDIPFSKGSVYTAFGELRCYARLKDVLDGEAGIVVGSSGFDERRFLEIVVKGGSAADQFGLKTGQLVFKNS